MPPAQPFRLAALTLLLTAGFPLLPTPHSPLPAIAQAQTTADRKAEGDRLNKLGIQQAQTSQYEAALQSFTQALTLYRAIPDRNGEAKALMNLGNAYSFLPQYERAIEFYQQALPIFQQVKNRNGEAGTLTNLGIAYGSLSQYERAIAFYQQALLIYQQVKDRNGDEANTLVSLGEAYRNLSQYERAIAYSQQALPIFQQFKNRSGKAKALGNLGDVYQLLFQHERAIAFYQQAFPIFQQVKDRNSEANTLVGLGNAYRSLSQHEQAIAYYRQALPIFQQIKDRNGEAKALGNLGISYQLLFQHEQAIAYYQQALPIFQQVKDRNGEATMMTGLGAIYRKLSQYERAISYHQQALFIFQQVKNRNGEAAALNNLGYLFSQRQQAELAIVFYKQSVNVQETIRRDVPRDRTLQESYTNSVAGTYRNLADLLLKQDRILEAQQVLDLLKFQELKDYLRTVRGTVQPVEFLKPELEILQKFEARQKTAVQLGQELSQLRSIAPAQRTAQQTQRIAQLVKLQETLNIQFSQFITSPDVKAWIKQLQSTPFQPTVNLATLEKVRGDLRRVNGVLIYPLILEDRLELVITTPDSAPLRRTVKVSKENLNKAILDFRLALVDPSGMAKAKAAGQQLYSWLIQPLEADLKQAKATTIIYAPDGQLRYIPLAALHDGNQWLVQRYRINNITATSLMGNSFAAQPVTRPRVLAGAILGQDTQYAIKERGITMTGLTYAKAEVANIASLFPNATTQLFGNEFNQEAVKPKMNDYSIIHFATHAAFVSGEPEQSFILFGDSQVATLKQIQEGWSLNVDLVVLSACQTGVGGKLGNGEEILGLGYVFQDRGAKATIASLWSVKDGGTSVLMSAFYAALQKGNSKAEALRQAQIELINDSNYRHPLYWAPFILIGNGL